MKKHLNQEAGQSIIIIAAALVVLVALFALVVDIGNAYTQQRQTQNAMDSAAQAGTIAWAQSKTGSQIETAVKNYAGANGVDKTKVSVYYVVQDGSGNEIPVNRPTDKTVSQYGADQLPPTCPAFAPVPSIVYNGQCLKIIGVFAQGDKLFPTYFAGVLGFGKVTSHATSITFGTCGACSSNSLFPVVVHADIFNSPQGTCTEQDVSRGALCNSVYTIYQNKLNMTGVSQSNYGYVQWPSDSATTTAIANDMDNAENNLSGSWRAKCPSCASGDLVSGNATLTADSNVAAALQRRINGTKSALVTVPVYDTYTDAGNIRSYNILGFARFKITCYQFTAGSGCASGETFKDKTTSDQIIEARLQDWLDPQATGGCADFGVCTIKSDNTSQTRSIVGTVKINQLTRDTKQSPIRQPADVMLVVDLSSSMGWLIDQTKGQSTDNPVKLDAAKKSLTNFIGQFITAKKNNPTWPDRLGLVSFPYVTTDKTSYPTDCGQSKTIHETGTLESPLTGITTTMKTISSTIMGFTNHDNTPTADAIKIARQTLLSDNAVPGAAKVIILATDGRANGRVDTHKYNGDNIDDQTCNNGALTDATNEAMIAKSDNNGDEYPDVTIFVIATGAEYLTPQFANVNTYFSAIATTDSSPTLKHFFNAGSQTELDAAFTDISTRLQDIGSETCKITPNEAPASVFQINWTNSKDGSTGTVWTTSTGEFVIPNPTEGTYSFTTPGKVVDGLSYDTFTLSVGGPDGSYTVKVKPDSGTYPVDLYLRTSTPPKCK